MGVRGQMLYSKRGGAGVLWGQSNANRCGNNTGTAAAAGYSLPTGAVYWENGLSLASYTALHHGLEVGILDEIITVAGKSATTLVKRGVDGTRMTLWDSTHAAALIADCVTAGVTPSWGICVQGEAEAVISDAVASGWASDALPVLADFRAAWGAAWPCVFVRIRTTDATNYPHHAAARNAQNVACARWQGVGIVSVDDSPLATDASGVVHYTSATAILAGRRAARLLLNAGVIL